MSNEKDALAAVIEDASQRSTRAIIDSLHANASADALKSLGSLEAEVGHLKNSAGKVETALAEQGETLRGHGEVLKRLSSRQIWGGCVVVALVAAFGFLSEHWPAVARLGNLLFGGSVPDG